MANFFNYPQVVMSLYDCPMEASGALSLGTSAGVGSSFSITATWPNCCGATAWSSSTRHMGSYADGDFIYWASCYIGVHSYPIAGGAYCDVLCPYTNVWPYMKWCDVTKGGNYFFASQTINHSSISTLYSFTADSNGDMTKVDDYRIGTNNITDNELYADTTLPLIFSGGFEGIAVFCYNTSTGVIGHTDYDFSNDLIGGCQVYSYIRSGCKIVVMARSGSGLAVWCMNTSTCMLGNAMCYNFRGNGSTTWLDSPKDVWGGCSTGCHLSDGGWFIAASGIYGGNGGLGVVCSYNDSGTTKLCLKTCFCVSNLCSTDLVYQVCGDDSYVYVTGYCGRLYRLTLNCSTGVLTCVDSMYYCSISSQMENRLHTREGYCVFVGTGHLTGYAIGKPAPHYSISGLYGGADNTDVALSHYYKGGSYVANNSSNTNVPTSGTIDFSDFYSQG